MTCLKYQNENPCHSSEPAEAEKPWYYSSYRRSSRPFGFLHTPHCKGDESINVNSPFTGAPQPPSRQLLGCSLILCYYLIRKDCHPEAPVTQTPSIPVGIEFSQQVRPCCPQGPLTLTQWSHREALLCSVTESPLGLCWPSGEILSPSSSQLSASPSHSPLHVSHGSSQKPESMQNDRHLETASQSWITWLPRTSHFPTFPYSFNFWSCSSPNRVCPMWE